MKSLIFVVSALIVTPLLAQAQVSQSGLANIKDCASSPLKLRQVSKTASNMTAKEWACAATKQVPFAERDTNPLVSECAQSSTLYREVNVDVSVACEVLVMADGTRHFLKNTPVALGWEPVYQSTVYGSNDAN